MTAPSSTRPSRRSSTVGAASLLFLLGLTVGCAQVESESAAAQAAVEEYPDQRLAEPINDLPNPYVRVQPWGELPSGPFDISDYDGRPSFIGAEGGPDGNIYALTRCMANSCSGRSEPPLLKYDPSGRILLAWGEGMFEFPHGLYVHDDGTVWTADQLGHTVYKFSPEGELLLTIGSRGTPGDPPNLNEPTDVVVAPNGDIFISEGHSNSPDAPVARVSKFAADGTFIKSWGAWAARRDSSAPPTPSPWTRKAASSSVTATTTGSRSSIRKATSSICGTNSADRAGSRSRRTIGSTSLTPSRTTSTTRDGRRG